MSLSLHLPLYVFLCRCASEPVSGPWSLYVFLWWRAHVWVSVSLPHPIPNIACPWGMLPPRYTSTTNARCVASVGFACFKKGQATQIDRRWQGTSTNFKRYQLCMLSSPQYQQYDALYVCSRVIMSNTMTSTTYTYHLPPSLALSTDGVTGGRQPMGSGRDATQVCMEFDILLVRIPYISIHHNHPENTNTPLLYTPSGVAYLHICRKCVWCGLYMHI